MPYRVRATATNADNRIVAQMDKEVVSLTELGNCVAALACDVRAEPKSRDAIVVNIQVVLPYRPALPTGLPSWMNHQN